MKYLNNFSSLIPSLQGAHAIRKVEKLRFLGEIQTEAEYDAALGQILSGVSLDTYQPTFRFTPFSPGVVSSIQFNEMMDQLRDDMEVAFAEASNIYDTISAHKTIFKDKFIGELNAALEELDREINKLSIIASLDNSFDDAFINDFTGDSQRIADNDRMSDELLYDTRLEKRLDSSENVFFNEKEALISLPLYNNKTVQISEVSVVTTETTGSDYNIQLEGSNVQNVISGAGGWVHNILKRSPLTGAAKLVIDIDMGDKRIINYLYLGVLADFPSVVDSIKYVDEFGELIDLPNSELIGKPLNKSTQISFDDIIVRRIIATFSQRSSTLFRYDSSYGTITLDDLRRNTSLAANAQMFIDQINEQIDNVDMLSVLPVTTSPTPVPEVVYQYTFGFTSVQAGLSQFRNNGGFASRAYRKSSPGLVGIEVAEIDTKYFDNNANTVASVGSFEYDIVKKDFNIRGELLDSKTLPVLPVGRQSVGNERLFFTQNRSTIPLRFLGHLSSGDGSGVKIYRDNQLLTRGADWVFIDRADQLTLGSSVMVPGLAETRIHILHNQYVIQTGIYTAEYTPRHIAEPNSIVSRYGVTTLNTNVLETPSVKGSEQIDYSLLYLKVAIRNNSFYPNKTPKLASYRVLASSVDTSKYVRL